MLYEGTVALLTGLIISAVAVLMLIAGLQDGVLNN